MKDDNPTQLNETATPKEPEQGSVVFLTSMGVTKVLASIMSFLIAMDLVRLYFKNKKPEMAGLNNYLNDQFKITGEFNLPTLFSAFILLLSGILLLIISGKIKTVQYRYHWLILGLVFIFLSLDESLMIHESLSSLIRSNFAVEGSLQYGTWSVPYIILTAIIGLIYLRFVLHLPAFTRLLFIISGSVFVVGAAGLELVEGYYILNYGEKSAIYRLAHWSQEIFEMVGIVIFIYTLMDYLGKTETKIAIKNTYS